MVSLNIKLFLIKNYLQAIHEIEGLLNLMEFTCHHLNLINHRMKNIFGLSKDGFCLTLDIPYNKKF